MSIIMLRAVYRVYYLHLFNVPCSTQAFTGTVSPRLNARQSQFSKRLDLRGGGGEVQF